MYQEQEQYEKAEETYLDTLKMAPDYFDALWGLAKLYEVQQKWDEAIKYYELSLKERSDWAVFALEGIGKAHEQKGDTDLAKKFYLQALEVMPNDTALTNALYDLVDVYKKANQSDKAIKLLEEIKSLKGENYEADFCNRVGIIYYEQKIYDKAIEYYQKALSLRPEEAV